MFRHYKIFMNHRYRLVKKESSISACIREKNESLKRILKNRLVVILFEIGTLLVVLSVVWFGFVYLVKFASLILRND